MMLTGQAKWLVPGCCSLHGTSIMSNKEILYLKIGIKSDTYNRKIQTQANFCKGRIEHGRESHHFNLNKVNLGQSLYTFSVWSTSSNI